MFRPNKFAARLDSLVRLGLIGCVVAVPVIAQSSASEPPAVVQPGAPGQPTKTLPSDTRPVLPAKSAKDVEFMQGMIHHHSQAVEMVALIEKRSTNAEVRRLGSRIAASQADEMAFMRRWLAVRGEATQMKMPATADHGSHSHGAHHSSQDEMLMPGMLTAKQMAELKGAKGVGFDRLFLAGMIQHHEGALVMVKELFNQPGAGQDAELFNFTTDVDSGQLAEIRIMQTLLAKLP